MTSKPLPPQNLAKRDLSGWPFLHQQGASVCRGFAVAFRADGDEWELDVRDVEYLDWRKGEWVLEMKQDTYGGAIRSPGNIEEDSDDGMISVYGYGTETYLAVPCKKPWSKIDWPETDSWEGGPLE
ncbi:hypothetical protein [Maricaulis sp.]|uniref:hypothetical protein n=1 Tax=Maricaulis sp. TaxID=1486257 RepID=UPI00261B7FCF|nr:hypothetical protein [Maricaulis sp.]